MAGRVSIRDLAKIAGVSRTTVSLALRDSHRISAEVRERIRDLAAKHNYRSHPMVTALMQQVRTKRKVRDVEVIAFVTSDRTEEGWKAWSWVRGMQEGASEEANRLGFRLETFWAGPGGKDAARLAKVLYHRGIRGLFFAPMSWPHPVFSIPWENFVSVACTTSTGIMELPVVRCNHSHGVRLLLGKLREKGARSIGIAITEEDDLRIERAWSSGVHGYRLDVPKAKIDLVRMPAYDRAVFASWFQKAKPEVVIGTRREIPRFIKELRLKCAYASLNVLADELGQIAGLHQDSHYLARKAVQYISKSIYDQSLGLPERAESILVDGRFVEGASLDPLAAGGPSGERPLAEVKKPRSRSKSKVV